MRSYIEFLMFLQRFNRHNIHSMPVVDEKTNKIVGILDVLDVIQYLSDLFPWDTPVEKARREIFTKKWKFHLKNIKELMGIFFFYSFKFYSKI
jgi:CBS domain containing-hemolysin-like protein